MKRVSLIILCLAAIACQRTAPVGTEGFRLQFVLPGEFKADAAYAGVKVTLDGSAHYEFTTDASGAVAVESVIPGIYDIVTSLEMTGAEYKALLREASTVKDDARVIVGVSLTGRRIFRAEDLDIDLTAAVLRELVISKIYYSGTRDKMDRTFTADSYVEIFNNSAEVQYLDGKYLGLAETESTPAYPASENPDSVYLKQLCKFPGSGTDYPVQPGKSILIAASSARNHLESADISADLSGADFEVKAMEGSGNPDVPMLPLVFNSYAGLLELNLISGGPNAVVLVETTEDPMTWKQVYQRGKTSGRLFLRMHKKWAADGVECLKKPAQSAPDVNTKRLQNDIDAGYQTISSVNGYNNESVERKVSRSEGGRVFLKDTNNSSVDFVVLTDPTPRKYDKEGLQDE